MRREEANAIAFQFSIQQRVHLLVGSVGCRDRENKNLTVNCVHLHTMTSSEAAPSPFADDAGWDESICTDPRSIVTQQSVFEGKTVVITGAGGQFGREGCLYFAKRGARIAALDMDIAALQGTFLCLQEALGKNLDCRLYVCNVTDATQIQQIFDSILHRFKHVDMLWNNAGYQGEILPTLEYSPVDFALVMNINVTGELPRPFKEYRVFYLAHF